MIQKSLKCLLLVCLIFSFSAITADSVEAQRSVSKKSKYKKSSRSKSKKRTRKTRRRRGSQDDLDKALKLSRSGQYEEASILLFQLGLSPRYASQRMRIRYLLGLMLYQMKLNQVSAFQFISVIRSNEKRYLKESLEKLSLAADALGDDTLLNYAISRVKAQSFPAVHRDMLFYRIGEFQVRNEQYSDAVRSLTRVKNGSEYYDNAQYLKALAYASSKKSKSAIRAFNQLIDSKEGAPVTDPARVAAVIGKARTYYQLGDWDNALEAYREVPRDTELWHDTLFESSWALLRSGRFRSALSNFQSLHSPYYEDSYLPESLILRSIVYLYICQYDEMNKVLSIFNKLYQPVLKSLGSYLQRYKDPKRYFRDVMKVLVAAEKKDFDPRTQKFPIPYIAVRKVVKEGDFFRTYEYIKELLKERRRVRQMPSKWRTSSLGKYALKTLERRIDRARAKAGRQARVHLLAVRAELIDLFEQEGFVRFEMLNGKREAAKKKVAGKDVETTKVNQDQSRDYYIQNGYQYWTFRGEYWLDELGNYHYVGTQSCK